MIYGILFFIYIIIIFISGTNAIIKKVEKDEKLFKKFNSIQNITCIIFLLTIIIYFLQTNYHFLS
jgi:hypothetical protein